MFRTTTMAAIGLLACTLPAHGQQAPEAPVEPAGPVHTIDSGLSVGGARDVRIDLGVGDVAVLGESTDRITSRLLVFCDKRPKRQESCEDHARDLALRSVADGDEVRVSVEGVTRAVLRRLRLRLEVRVPANLALEVRVGDGGVRVDGVLGDSDLEVQNGSIDVTIPESEVAELKLRAGGEASVERTGEQIAAKAAFTAEIRWLRQSGVARVAAFSRFGNVRVVLD